MTFGEKIKEARLAMNLSQTELAQMTGISERSLYTYEQLGTLPRKSNIRKLAEALHISVSYLLDESETDSQSHIDQDMFILEAKEEFLQPDTIFCFIISVIVKISTSSVYEMR